MLFVKSAVYPSRCVSAPRFDIVAQFPNYERDSTPSQYVESSISIDVGENKLPTRNSDARAPVER